MGWFRALSKFCRYWKRRCFESLAPLRNVVSQQYGMKRSHSRMTGILKELLLGPPGLILLGVLISGIGAFWFAFQQAGVERELRLRSDKIAELSQNALHSVTGGDSFCYLQFMDLQPENGQLMVVHKGKHPIYGVEARIVDLDGVAKAATQEGKMKELMGQNIHIGNLAPKFARYVVPWKETVPGQLRLNIFFAARNGSYTQLYRRLRVHDGWAIATRVEHNGKDVLEEVSDSFPRNQKGEIDWE